MDYNMSFISRQPSWSLYFHRKKTAGEKLLMFIISLVWSVCINSFSDRYRVCIQISTLSEAILIDISTPINKLMDDSSNSNSQQHLANQRTFLAWLKTCVALIGLGFIVSRFGLFLFSYFYRWRSFYLYHKSGDCLWKLDALLFNNRNKYVVLGIVFTLFALRNYIYTYESIEQGIYSPKHFDIYLLSLALVILGVFIVAYLVPIPFLIG